MKELELVENAGLTLNEFGVIAIDDLELLDLVSGGADVGNGSGNGNNVCGNSIGNGACPLSSGGTPTTPPKPVKGSK